MTGIMAEPVTYRPSWHFEVINDPTEWQWEPPTTPETRHKNNAKVSVKNLSGKLLRWLEASDMDKPFLDPPSEVLDSPTVLDSPAVLDSLAVTESPAVLNSPAVVESPAITESPAVIESPTAEQSITVPSADPVTINKELHQLRSAICGLETVTKASLWPLRDQFIQNLIRRIKSGDITVEDLVETMVPVDAATLAHIPDPLFVHSVILNTRRAIITTLSNLRRKDRRDDYREAWAAVLNDSLAATANGTRFRTLALIIEYAQPKDRDLVPVDRLVTGLYDLIRSMVASSSPMKTGRLVDVVQLARAVQLLKPSMREAVGQKVESALAETFDAGLSYDYRYWWMLFKAHYTHISFSEFEEAVNSYLGTDKRPNDHQSLLLISARMYADGCLHKDPYISFTRQIRGGYQEKHWSTLAGKVIQSRGHVGLTSFWCHLGALKWDVRFFEALIACSWQRSTRQNTERVIKAIVSNPLIPSLRFWLALKDEKSRIMTPEPTSTKASDDPDDGLITKEHLMKLVDKIACWYETAPDLSNRMAFRGVSRCIRFQTELSGRPSATVLSAMTNVVTASLREGQPAPAKRLQHYLANIVAPSQGLEVAQDCGNTLDSWQKQASLEAVLRGKRRE
ncbi:unnamed protein product [Clonostachys solani]|uniref:Uncharacterized protein n=1 Tax=Clonostachys solani TaxID=160281 RepID=A0A9N9Z5Y7_9HYPO|nr:unnamed protein product [Clonostachys solani]